jgi:DNA repair exonuclease SbcCD ATPase subunit
VTSDSESNDGGKSSAGIEIPHDALGDTQLGRSLRELIKEIGKEKDAAQKRLASGEAPGSESQDGDDFDPSLSRFDQALELAASTQEESGSAENGAASTDSPSSAPGKSTADSGPAGGQPDAELSQAISGMEAVLQRFAEAERRRCEQKLAEWKVQLKKATMIVIKKQVDTARAKWMKNLSTNQETIAEHYRRLKLLTDRVAKQKAQIQKAKKELEKKLEVADRLHDEFDEIRHVLDGQIGAIDDLDKNEE